MGNARRKLLQSGGALLGALALSRLSGQGKAQAAIEAEPVAYPPLIISRRVPQVPQDPKAQEWERATPVRIALGPQIIVKPRLREPSVREVLVRFVHDDERVGVLLEWEEKTETMNTGIGRTDHFRDAVALSFPANLDKPIPYFGMGHVDNEVIIYQWKSDWEFGPDYDVDQQFPGMWVDHYPMAGKKPGEMASGADYGRDGKEWPASKVFNTGWAAGSPLADPELKRKTSVEKLVASGFGHLTSDSTQDGLGRAKWGHGWHVVISFPRRQDRYTILPGRTYPINFAVWDGHHGERGAEKSISTWSSFVLERPVMFPSFALGLLAAAAIGAVEWAILRRRKASRSSARERG